MPKVTVMEICDQSDHHWIRNSDLWPKWLFFLPEAIIGGHGMI
jgi:hypothetical protein